MDKVVSKELMEKIAYYTQEQGVNDAVDLLSKMLLLIMDADDQFSSSREFEEGRVFIITNKERG